MTGRLVLVATPLGNMADLSPRAAEALAAADVVACEDTRRTGKLLSLAGIEAVRLTPVHEHNEASAVGPLVARMQAGATVVLVSDAGTPVISDPGARLVRAAIDADIPVTVVPGPAAAVAGLVVSGLPADRWVFEGFLPRKGRDRATRLTELAGEQRTAVLYEAPHRLLATLEDLADACGADRPVVLARELTKLHEETWRGDLGDAVAHARDRAPRGEYVIVLGGAPAGVPATDEQIAARLAAEGTTVASVAAELGLPKNRVYGVQVRARGAGIPAGTPTGDR